MILDSSAVIAILVGEAAAAELVACLDDAPHRAIGAPTATETGVVLASRLGPPGLSILGRFLDEFEIDVVPFSVVHWQEGVHAFQRFGRGRHPAGLSFGDCLTYAVAKVAGDALLCTGGDFARTDLAVAPAAARS
ncbi:MAG TPA: type II toxin-antitoxin system VapC family toxin [Candidatus Micrarchaeia archaeon]|nr:type II toxin-antitoxin system VapC family toxin [Candidatus Micrarchaeia archaeon]